MAGIMKAGLVLALAVSTGAGEMNCLAEEIEESVSIVTYYPSPYGSYQELSSEVIKFRSTDGPPDRVSGREEKGMLYYDKDEGFKYYNGDEWKSLGGGSEAPLVGAAHTESDCLNSGGEVVDTAASMKQCRFARSTCPAGWTQYKNWTATSESNSGSQWTNTFSIVSGTNYCTVKSSYVSHHTVYYAAMKPGVTHSWADQAVESCVYRYYMNYAYPEETLSAKIDQIGCY